MTASPSPAEFARQRENMVERQLRARGVDDRLVLAAMRRVRREHYVDPAFVRRSYDDSALPIAHGQTISQPYIVGYMLQALRLCGGERVLEVGTGSGYAAAVLAEIAGRVFTIERQHELAAAAAARLRGDGYVNVTVRAGDGSRGWPDQAPFDAIVVAAGAAEVPPALPRQLAVGGRLVIPVGPHPDDLRLLRMTRTDDTEFVSEQLVGVRFVPLVVDR